MPEQTVVIKMVFSQVMSPSVMTYSILLIMRNRLFTVICSGAIAEIFNMKKRRNTHIPGKKEGWIEM